MTSPTISPTTSLTHRELGNVELPELGQIDVDVLPTLGTLGAVA